LGVFAYGPRKVCSESKSVQAGQGRSVDGQEVEAIKEKRECPAGPTSGPDQGKEPDQGQRQGQGQPVSAARAPGQGIQGRAWQGPDSGADTRLRAARVPRHGRGKISGWPGTGYGPGLSGRGRACLKNRVVFRTRSGELMLPLREMYFDRSRMDSGYSIRCSLGRFTYEGPKQ
jgi:hypothetical protein